MPHTHTEENKCITNIEKWFHFESYRQKSQREKRNIDMRITHIGSESDDDENDHILFICEYFLHFPSTMSFVVIDISCTVDATISSKISQNLYVD